MFSNGYVGFYDPLVNKRQSNWKSAYGFHGYVRSAENVGERSSITSFLNTKKKKSQGQKSMFETGRIIRVIYNVHPFDKIKN